MSIESLLGITRLSLRGKYATAENSDVEQDSLESMTAPEQHDASELPMSLREDIQNAVPHLTLTFSSANTLSVTLPHIALPHPLSADDKKHLWQHLAQLTHGSE